MLEIIVLIFLTKRIGEIAVQKGLPAGWWKFYAVLGWVGGEIIGVVLGIMLFDTDSIFRKSRTSWAVILTRSVRILNKPERILTRPGYYKSNYIFIVC